MLSIVIPTLNEGDCLPLLLGSIKKQNFKGKYELIVSDAGSKDNTIEIAENFRCKIAQGGWPGKGKNEGAKLAAGELILFADADVIFPEDFIEKNLKEFELRNLDVASFCLQSTNKIHNILFKILFNFPSIITEKILPQAMNIILVKNDLHKRIGGFDEEVKLGEELDYIRRGAEIGEFGVLKSVKIFVSSRRFQQDGWLKTWMKYFLCQFYMFFLGPVKSDIFKYKFNHYKK